MKLYARFSRLGDGVERKRSGYTAGLSTRAFACCAAAAGFSQPRGGPRILLDSAASLALRLWGLRIAHEAMLAVQGAMHAKPAGCCP